MAKHELKHVFLSSIIAVCLVFNWTAFGRAGSVLNDDFRGNKGKFTKGGGEIIGADDTTLQGARGWGNPDREYPSDKEIIYRIPKGSLGKSGTIEVLLTRVSDKGRKSQGTGFEAFLEINEAKFTRGARKYLTFSILWNYWEDKNKSGLMLYPEKNSPWGMYVPFGRKIGIGETIHLAFTWGENPGENRILLNGKPLKTDRGSDGYDGFTYILPQMDIVRIGRDLGGYQTLYDTKIGGLAIDNTATASFALADFKPVIQSVTDDTFSVPGISGKLTTGDTIQVRLEAEAGGTASFDMGAVTGIPMTEVTSDTTGEGTGVYEGSYTIKPGDDFDDGQIVGHFASAAGIEADPVTSDSRWTIDTGTLLALEVDKNDLPADTNSRSRIKVTVTDINGNEVEGHHVRVDLATTEEYTGLVGAGDFGENVGAEVEATWKSVTDSWGEVEFDYRSGFSAKTVIVTAKDLTTGSVGVDFITSYIDALIDIALTAPVSKAAAARGLLYYMNVEASRTELTADGRSRSVIRAHVYDPGGNPVEGDEVEFTLDQDNGTIRTIKAITDKNGRATAEYRAGKRIGIVQVTAFNKTRNLTGYVSITLLSDAPAKIHLAARPASLPADGFSKADVEVMVTDINDNPNPDTEVLFSMVKGSGTLKGDTLITDRFGETANVFTSGEEPGIATIKATVKSKVPTEEELETARNVLFATYSDLDDEMRLEKWLVRKGDEVKEGDPICNYSIRGENFTLTAPYDLEIIELLAESWDYLEVGQTLAIVAPVTLP